MSITFTTTQAGASADYMRYLWRSGQEVTKTDKYKSTCLLDFALARGDSSFVKLARGAYIDLNTVTYPHWFTGYITNNPDLQFLGSNNGAAVYGYVYHASADEYILSLNPIGVVPTFFNVHMGTIIKTLAARICPGKFDLSNVQDGPLVAQYVVDPTKTFFAVTQDLCQAASYVFYGNNHKLYFAPQDDTDLPATVLDGNSKHFTPANLKMSAVSAPIVNDVTVVGQVEPQDYVQEYFIGTGLQSAFQLIDSVFGADSSVLIDESFGSSSIDTSKWNVRDHSAQYLQILNGYLNCLGGSSDASFDVNLQSICPLPMEGNLRFTHGEFDFLGGNGVVGSLWTGAVNSSFSGCLYGIAVSGTTLNPVCNGSGDGSQTITVSTSRRYCIRTVAQFTKMNRTVQPYSYIDSNGVVQTVTGISSGADTVTWKTFITEIDPITGLVTNRWTWTNVADLTGANDTYAIYAPVVSNNLFATVTGITVSVPLNASVALSSPAPFANTGFDTWVDSNHLSAWTGESADGVYQESDLVVEGSALRLKQETDPYPYVAQYANDAIAVGKAYTVQVQLRKTLGMTTGNLLVVLDGTGLTETGITIPVASIPTSQFLPFSGVLTTPLSSIPSDLALKVYLTGCSNTGESVYVDEIQVATAWALQLVGPNEIDAVDGLAPIATIVQPNSGSSTQSTYTGAPQYNSGQGQLVFFSDSITQTSNVPPVGQLVRVTYRSAGAAIGRAANMASVATEAGAWGDSGIRSVVQMGCSPRPRTAVECELAAQALVAENSYQHYQGTYQQRSEFSATYIGRSGSRTVEPRAGSLIKFQNLSSMAPVTAEEIGQVTTVLDNAVPESFIHTISFGKPDNIQVFLNKVQNPVGSFQVAPDASAPSAVDTRAVGLVFAPDVTNAALLSWDDSSIFMDAGQTLTPASPARNQHGSYFEVRYTNRGWGADDGRNLVVRTNYVVPDSSNGYGRYFSVPKTLRGQVFFIRQCSRWNYLDWSEDLTHTQYSCAGASVANSRQVNPDGKLSTVSTVTFGAGGSIGVLSSYFDPIAWISPACWSFSIKGTAGQQFTASATGQPNVVFLATGGWQRISVPITAGSPCSLALTSMSASVAQVTRWSVEYGTAVETLYVKTQNGVGGVYSRYSAAVHVAFPPPNVPLQALPTIIRVTADTALVAPSVGDLIAEIDTTGGAVTVTLPPSSSYIGQNITCVLVSYGSANGVGYHDATITAGTESTVGGGTPVQDTYSGQASWTFDTQWQGREFTGVA